MLLFVCLPSILMHTLAAQRLTILSRDYSLDERYATPEHQFYFIFKQALEPELNTKLEWTNHARIFKMLDGDDDVCSYNIIKTPERSKQLLFSDAPTTLFPQKRVYFYPATLNTSAERISIASLLQQKRTFAAVASSNYGQLGELFAAYPKQVSLVKGAESFTQVSQMLLHKRIDFLVEYDYTIKRLLTPSQYQLLTHRAIAEYNEFVTGYFACSNTKVGEQAIEKINALFKTPQMHTFLKQVHYQQFDEPTAAKMMALLETKYGLIKATSDK